MIPFAVYNAAETPNAFQWAGQPPKLPLPVAISTLMYYIVPWAQKSHTPNGILIGSAILY